MKKSFIIMVVAIAFSINTINSITVLATPSSITDVQMEKDEVLKELKELEENLNTYESEIEKLKKNINELNTKKIILNKELKSLKGEVKELENDIDSKYEIINSIIKLQYEQKKVGYMEMLLESKNFSNFLKRLEFISKLIRSNNDAVTELTNMENKLEEKNKKIEANLLELENDKEIQVKEKNKVEELIKESKQEKKELITMRKKLDKELTDLQKELSNNASGGDYGGGIMAWPVPGYSYISSYYGYRKDPISGVSKLHKGVDIPAPEGTPVMAGNKGKVIKAGYNTAFGNLVVIDHGGGVLTYYAHNTSLLVSVGQTVTKGQQIATVGTTGYSTGNHVHFEVHVNGSAVDPMKYLN